MYRLSNLIGCGIAALILSSGALWAEEGGGEESPAAKMKALQKEARSITGKITYKMRKLLKEDEDLKAMDTAIKEKIKAIAKERKALYAKAAEKDPEIKEWVARKGELNKQITALKGSKKKKGNKKKKKAK